MIFVAWLAWLIVFPLILNLNLLKKLVWILANYIFFCSFIIGLGYLLPKSSDESRFEIKIARLSPAKEYSYFQSKSSFSVFKIDPNHYLLNEFLDHDTLNDFHYVTNDLYISFIKTRRQRAIDIQARQDSIIRLKDPSWKLGEETDLNFPEIIELTATRLDSMIANSNEIYKQDFELTSYLKDSAVFKGNKEYFKRYNDFLVLHDNALSDLDQFPSIRTKSQIVGYLTFDDRLSILYKVDSLFFEPQWSTLMALDDRLEGRSTKSNLIMNLIFFPVNVIMERFDLY